MSRRDLSEEEQEIYDDVITKINQYVNPMYQERIISKIDDLVDEIIKTGENNHDDKWRN